MFWADHQVIFTFLYHAITRLLEKNSIRVWKEPWFVKIFSYQDSSCKQKMIKGLTLSFLSCPWCTPIWASLPFHCALSVCAEGLDIQLPLWRHFKEVYSSRTTHRESKPALRFREIVAIAWFNLESVSHHSTREKFSIGINGKLCPCRWVSTSTCITPNRLPFYLPSTWWHWRCCITTDDFVCNKTSTIIYGK